MMAQLEHLILLTSGTMLAIAAVLTLIRIVLGPSVLDRAVATEVLVAVLIVAIGLEAAVYRDTTALPTIISLALLSFTSSVAIALFVGRDRDDRQPGVASRPGHSGVGPAGQEHDPVPESPSEDARGREDRQ